MGKDDAGVEQGGGGCLDISPYILGGGLFGTVVQVSDVGDDTLHQGGAGQIPPQGGPQCDL